MTATTGLDAMTDPNPYRAWAARAQQARQNSASAEAPPDYPPFEVFPSGSVNLGIRLVYRQHWRLLGTQKGEIVRTIPLAPGQTERVSTKIVSRQKRATNLETTTSVETQSETSETTKDSSEIVNEAMKSWDLTHSHEANVSVGVFGAKGSTSIGFKDEDKSKETSASLSEAMRKTAQKTTRASKVTVATEGEQSFETERSSEIVNSNNEVAVTYEYREIQHQYEVFTQLAELQMVVFVAEDLPTPAQLHDQDQMLRLIRSFDWILAKVLKDESFRENLNYVTQNDPPDDQVTDGKIAGMLDTAKSEFARFHPDTGGEGGLSIPDIYSEPQRIYQQELRAREERTAATLTWQRQFERLADHIRRNLLYYWQAIWSQEPADQRLLRYKKEGRRVPVQWRGSRLRVQDAGAFTTTNVADFSPTGLDADVWELIDPTGPLAYIGNYAVFALKPVAEPEQASTPKPRVRRDDQVELVDWLDDVLGINDLLRILARPYTDRTTHTLRDPARDAFEREAATTSAEFRRQLSDAEVFDFLSYLPHVAGQLLDSDDNVVRSPDGDLNITISVEDWAEYLYRRNGTRRFLVDSNNVYLDIKPGSGSVLEPFKRAHRYLDVLKAEEVWKAETLKNERRYRHLDASDVYDPDVGKVVIVGDGAATAAAAGVHSTDATDADSQPEAETPTEG